MTPVRTKAKKIRKVIKLLNGGTGVDTDTANTLHTLTDPATTKRFILAYTISEDTFVDNDRVTVGLCITRPGETLPDTANIEAEENRWLWVEVYGARNQEDSTPQFKDMKIQRKLKDGDVISLVSKTTTDGHINGSVTIFLDET